MIRDRKICKKCKHLFKAHHKSNIFCSLKCSVLGRSGITRKNRIPVKCEECGSMVTRNLFVVKSFTRFFCNKECKDSYQRKQFSGELNPNFKNAGWKICIGCGTRYHNYNPTRKFCGTACTQIYFRTVAMDRLQKGLLAEQEVAFHLRHLGYAVWNTVASRGPFDIFAFNAKEILFIQVKATCSRHNRKPPKFIRALSSANLPIGLPKLPAKRQLWVKVDGEGWTITDVLPNSA